jgi:hypothetical protein
MSVPDESGNPQRVSDADLDRVRERLSFYERFDQIIQDSVSRAGDLLRQAATQAESAQSDVGKERLHYRALFAAMLDEVTALQGQAERLARRISDALDETEARLPPGGLFPPITDVLPGAFEEPPPTDDGHGGVSEAPSHTSDSAELNGGAPSAPDEAPAPRAGAGETSPATQPPSVIPESAVQAGLEVTPERSPAEPGLRRPVVPNGSGAEDAETVVSTLLLHGVPRAASALSLKSYLEQLDYVSAVEPREFAAGVLRLQIVGNRALRFADLSGWEASGRLEALNSRSGLIEARLRAA